MFFRSSWTRDLGTWAGSALVVVLGVTGLAACIGSGDDSVVPIPSADASPAHEGGASDATADQTAGEGGSKDAASDGTTTDGGSTDASNDAGPPLAAFSPSGSTLDFGAVNCGSTATQTLTITNHGGSTLTVGANLSVGTASYTINPSSLSIGAGSSGSFTLTATVLSTAQAGAALSGSLSLFTNDPTHQNVSLALSATPTGATLVATPQSITFGSTEPGVAEQATSPITLTNSGNASASFTITPPSNSAFTLSGTTDGGAETLAFAAGSSPQSLTATFLPSAQSANALTATSSITLASGVTCGSSTPTIQFSGTTAAGSLSGLPSSIDFGPVACGGSAPASQTFTLTNASTTTAAHITNVDISNANGFATNALQGAVIGPNNGTLSVTFTAPPGPTASYTVSPAPVKGTIVIHTDADPPGSSGTSIGLTEEPTGAILQFVTTTGGGCTGTLGTTFGQFGQNNVLLEPVAGQSFCVENVGNLAASVALSTGGDDAGADPFQLQNAGPFTVGTGTPSNVYQDQLTFVPMQANQTTGSLSMSVPSPTALCGVLPQPIPLAGAATGGGLQVRPTTQLMFYATCGGGPPGAQTFTVWNIGTTNLNWSWGSPDGGPVATGPGASLFEVSADPPPGLLAPNTFSTVTVRAASVPSPAPNPNPAALTAQLTINTDVPFDTGQVVTLTEVPVGDQIALSTNTVAFGQIPVTTTPVDQTFTITNNANPGSPTATLNLSLGGGANVQYFSPPTTSGGDLGAGDSEVEQVQFTPAAANLTPYIATLSITSSDPQCTPLPSGLKLEGTAIAGALSITEGARAVTATGLSFGLVDCGSTGTPQTLTITNGGNETVQLTSLSLGKGSSSPYTLSGPATSLPVTLALGGGSTTLTVTPSIIPTTATANDMTTFGDTLSIGASQTNLSTSIPLTMTPQGATIANTSLPTTWNFGTVGAGSIGTFTTTITNTGNAPATVTLRGVSQPKVFGLQSNPTTVLSGVTEIIGQFTPPSANGSWSDQGQLVVNAVGAFCGPLPSQWTTPDISFAGTSNGNTVVTLTGNLAFPTTSCGDAAPAGQAVTLTNSANQAYDFTASLASGQFYTVAVGGGSSGGGTLGANGVVEIVVTPKQLTPGPGVVPGSAPYADDLTVSVATTPQPTVFTLPVAWTLNGAVLSLPQGAGLTTNSQGQAIYVADGDGDFPLTIDNSGTATASVTLTTSGPFTLQPPSPVEVLPGIPTRAVLTSTSGAPACPQLAAGNVGFAYSGPVCQPIVLGGAIAATVSVDSCSGTYTLGPGNPEEDAGTEPDATISTEAGSGSDAGTGSDGGSDASTAPSACTVAPCAATGANSVTCSPGGNDVCTPTEAAFVNSIDIPHNSLTASGQLNPCNATAGECASDSSCYACLVNNDCIDNSVNGDTDKECGDLSASSLALDGVTTDPNACLNVVNCFIASGCATANPPGACYCGSESGASCQTNPGDGPCVGQVIDGLGNIPGDTCTGTPTATPTAVTPGAAVCNDTAASATTVFNDFTAGPTATPMAVVLFACGISNCPVQCGLQ